MSNYSAKKSNYSRRSEHSDSPFTQITQQQTKSLLMGAPSRNNSAEMIVEE